MLASGEAEPRASAATRILVAGASGQLAPAVIAGLERGGFAPVLLARCSFGVPLDYECVTLPGPWTTELLATAIAPLRLGGIVNLAAAGVQPGKEGLGALFEVNVALVAALLDASPASVCAFVNIGSGAEYRGDGVGAALSELAPLTESHPYGLSKAASAFVGKQTADERRISFAHLRLFGAFGENEAAHRLLPSLASTLSRSEPVLLSDGRQIRDWLYEEDVGEAVSATVAALLSGQMASGFYNLGSGRGTTVRAFAESVADVLKAPRELLRFGAIARRDGEGQALVADCAALAAATGWKPSYTLEAGIRSALKRLGCDERRQGAGTGG